MTALPHDAMADLQQRIAELERQLETAVEERDAAIERQTASALVNFRLKNELRAVTDRQKAGAEILNAIANTQGDAEHALLRIAETTQNFFNAASVTIRIADGDRWARTVRVGSGGHLTGSQPTSDSTARGMNLPATVYRDNRQIHIPDLDNIDPSMAHWPATAARAAGIRTISGTPLRRDGKAMGALLVYRDRLAAFTEDELALQQSFADQAVIAIENARRFNATEQALARQTATSEILRVISGSPTDVQPVFDAIVQTTVRLLGCETSFIQRSDGTHFWTVARCTKKEGIVPVFHSRQAPIDPGANFPSRAIVAKQTLYLPDWSEIELPEFERRIQKELGYNSAIYLPLLREGACIGVLGIAGSRPHMFSEADIALAESFRDQAVIAIENTRLFNETKEALERQTATAEILKVIASSPSDVQPVFDAIAERARHLIGGHSSAVTRVIGDELHLAATGSTTGKDALARLFPMPLASQRPNPVVARTGQVVVVADTESDPEHVLREVARDRGYRSMVAVPMLRDGVPIGTISVTRAEPGNFDDNTIGLLKTFADQAVIAIENTRLFNETQEALERQTATADILKVIASSPSDVQPVFDAIAANANRLVGGFSTAVYRVIDDIVHMAAFTPTNPESDAALKAAFPMHRKEVPAVALVENGETAQIADAETADPQTQRLGRARGWRSVTFTPLMSQGQFIGFIVCTRRETGVLGEHHVQLLRTFADQAVIAIENVRLFNETREALERQTATADVLKVIASSPSDVQPVFDAIVERAVQLCGARLGRIYRYDGELIRMVGSHGVSAPARDAVQQVFPRPASDDTLVGKVMLSRQPNILADLDADPSVPPLSRDMITTLGARSQVTMPMLHNGQPIGAITLSWVDPHGYNDQQIALLQTFADQAVIAIENTRLFNETQEALKHQTASSEVLQVIGRSMADTQPVFERIVDSIERLLPHKQIGVFLVPGDGLVYAAALRGLNMDKVAAIYPMPVEQSTAPVVLEARRQVYFPDLLNGDGVPLSLRRVAEIAGNFSDVLTPMLWEGRGVGMIAVTREANVPFSQRELSLLQTFADQAVIAIENTRLFNETQEALERQTATADILKVIASSPSDVQPVFDAILARALQLCEAAFGFLSTYDGERFALGAQLGVPPSLAEHFGAGMDQPLPGDAHRRLMEGEDLVHNLDQKDEDAYRLGNPLRRAVVDLGGARSALVVALRKGGALRGSITIYRKEVKPFSTSQIELLRHFADQAVIAIENTRLFNEVQERTVELTEALEQQTATAEVLSVISSSPGDLAPVFDAMLGKAMQLCSANFGVLNTYDGKAFHTGATYGLPPAYDEYRRGQPLEYGPDTAPARLLAGEPFVEFTDLRESEAYRNGEPNRRALVDIGGAHCLLAVPLLKDERVVGNIMIFRQENRPFSEKQIALLQQFAAQAVIAIENTRLLRELRESTEDLSESLQQQTATSEVLQIISSSPGELAPVFDKMLENATRVCGAEFGSMTLVEGDTQRQAALYNAPPAFAAVRVNKVLQIHPRSSIAAAIRTKQVVQVEDLRNYPAYLESNPASVQLAELGGARTLVVVPMLRDDEVIGAITVYRQEVRPFSQKQVELLTNFARQAVIAIENARLLRELRQRTDDLSESLEQQTAISDILGVISSSPGDIKPVFQTVARHAAEICEAQVVDVLTVEDDRLVYVAHFGDFERLNQGESATLNRDTVMGRSVVDKQPIHIADLQGTDHDFALGREYALRFGHRTTMAVPLIRDDHALGTILIRRPEVRPFEEKHIALLKMFADQAVIAIENARLLRELRQRTDDLSESLQFQTAASEVLKVISRSPDTLQPVLDVIVETSRELCGADASTIFLLREAKFHVAATSGSVPTHLDHLKANPLPVGQPGSILSRIYDQKRTINLENVMDDPELRQGSTGLGGARALLTVPLLSEGQVIGAITLRNSHLRPFTPRQIQAIETFADQAVIAISNVNLFEQVQQRTRELSKSLDDLRTAQDRLIQTEKLASLGQLTAGIAHEIKNPLNFVNNFAALSAELTDELKDILKPAVLDETIRAEVDEVTGLLKDNLGKVVQHGKRADSIVKNMLLHSREGSGEHRPADVNALVDESLNLAYHGARAEKPQFNVTLRRDFDPNAGLVEVFPQEITRVLLNLISNGFYAVTRRKADNGAADFEPLVTATTRGGADHVEIRIRDNGTGIPPEVKEKMFNPFFTTKPAGEGTGLGLSMSHDIIVKQHGGTIEVETEPGAFTEFRLVLPRTSLARANGNR